MECAELDSGEEQNPKSVDAGVLQQQSESDRNGEFGLAGNEKNQIVENEVLPH